MTYPIHNFNDLPPDSPTVPPTIHIGHGNGFPASMYAPFADALGGNYRKLCLLARPWWKGSDPEKFDSWEILADDLIAGIQHHNLAPIVGIGHSMSGVAMLFAAVKAPQLFRAIVLIDPVMLPRTILFFERILKFFGTTGNSPYGDRCLKTSP